MSSSQLAAHTRNVEERGEESSDQSRHFKPEPHDRSDVEVFSSDEGVLCLHSFLLMMHSKVFAAAFSNDDMPVKHLSIEHDYKTLKTFFSAFGYTMNYQRLISKDNAIALAELAFKYVCPSLSITNSCSITLVDCVLLRYVCNEICDALYVVCIVYARM